MTEYIDYVKEKEKSVVCLIGGIAFILSAFTVATNSRFFAQYFIYVGLYEIKMGPGVFVCAAALCLLGISMLLLSGSAKRGRKIIELRKEAREEQSKTKGYVSVGDISGKNKVYSAKLKKSLLMKRVAVLLAVLAVICFLILFFIYDVGVAAEELGKDDIDRSVTDFRVWANLIGKFFAFAGMSVASLCCVFIMNNRYINKNILYVAIGLLSLAVGQQAYFFFGDIMAYPCIADFLIIAGEVVLAALCVLSVLTEKIKVSLKSMGNNVEVEY